MGSPLTHLRSMRLQYNGAGEGLVAEGAVGVAASEAMPIEGMAQCEDDD
jgi:hypothetical protein